MSAQQGINQGDDNFIQFNEVSSSCSEVKTNHYIPNTVLIIPNNSVSPVEIRVSCRRAISSFPYHERPMRTRARSSYNLLQEPALRHRMIDPAPQRSNNVEKISTKFALASVLLIFVLSLLALFYVYSHFPNVTEEERQHIKIPWNIQDAKQLGIVLNRYKSDHYYEVMAGVFVTYVFLQTFAIPGSLFLSILSGFLFPFPIALILVCTCSALGASLCFLLSQLLGRKLVLKYFPERAAKWAEQVEKHRDNLTNYIIFLRVTPFLPNWFINLSAPVIGVPLVPFALGTFLGVAPPSFIAIQGGQTLQSMTENDSAFTWTSVVWLLIFGVISLVPIFIKNTLKQKEE